jgi:hypothetical protein
MCGIIKYSVSGLTGYPVSGLTEYPVSRLLEYPADYIRYLAVKLAGFQARSVSVASLFRS